MILAVALLLGAAVVGWTAPRYLHRLTTSRVDPVLAITWWFLTCASVAATSTAGVVLVVLPEHGPTRWVLDRLHGCWSTATHGSVPRLDDLIGLAGTLMVVGVLARVGVAAVKRRSQALRVHRRQLDLLRLAAQQEAGPVPVLWLDHPHPLAYSVAGKPAFVVASRGLARQLSTGQVAAVLAHEHAHLQGRHHVVVGFAEAMARALPFLPLMRQAPSAIRVLVEMAADRVAAAHHGPDTVRSALLRVGAFATPSGALAMADHGLSLRAERLADTAPNTPARHVSAFAAATLAAVSLPALVGFGLLTTTALISCPLM